MLGGKRKNKKKRKDIKYKVMVHLHPFELRVQIVISGLDAWVFVGNRFCQWFNWIYSVSLYEQNLLLR